jgi:hypothetical protein
MTKVGWYAVDTSTTLESNKSQAQYVANSLALLDTVRTFCFVRDRCYDKTPVLRNTHRFALDGPSVQAYFCP